MQRRVVGPTIITIVLCGLVADYLFLGENAWSVTNFLARTFAVFGAIFAPMVRPESYSWFGNFSLPVILILVAAIVLWLMVAQAKKAMRQVTANPDVSVAATRQAAPRISVQASEVASVPAKPVGESRRYPVAVKLAVCFGGVGMLFGIAIGLFVYRYLERYFETEIKSRAQVMALGLTDVASRQSAFKDPSSLSEAVDKIASSKLLAYSYVEDPSGQMIAYSPKDLPRFLNRDFPVSAERALKGVEIQYRNSDVYEIAKRVGVEKFAYVHVGVWRAAMSDEARAAVLPIAATTFLLVLVTTGVFVFWVKQLNRPFLELVEQAERISKGDFDVPLALKREDEIGDIARSLERMRSSLHAVVRRLEQASQPEQSRKEF